MSKLFCLWMLMILVVLVACAPVPTPTPVPTATPVPPTSTPVPTATLVLPTATAVPTRTAIPPTATSVPTNTPVPPTRTWTPILPSRTPTIAPIPPTATRPPDPCNLQPDQAGAFIVNNYDFKILVTIGGGDWGTHDYWANPKDVLIMPFPPGRYTTTITIPGKGTYKFAADRLDFVAGRCIRITGPWDNP